MQANEGAAWRRENDTGGERHYKQRGVGWGWWGGRGVGWGRVGWGGIGAFEDSSLAG